MMPAASMGYGQPTTGVASPPAGDAPRTSRSRRVAIDVVGFLDVTSMLAGGLLPAAIYGHFGELDLRWLPLLQACLVTSLFAYLCLRHYGHYDTQRIHALPVQPGRILAAIGLSFAAVLGLAIPFGVDEAHFWVWYGTWAAMSATLVLGVRLLARGLLARLTRAGHFDSRVAVYGGGTIADRLAQHLADPALGLRFAGVFDDRGGQARYAAGGTSRAGNLDDLIAAGRAGHIDQIIIALPQSADGRTAEVARRLEQLPVSLHVCTHIASDLVDQGPAYTVSSLGAIGLLDIKMKPLADWGRHLKAAEDYVIGAMVLLGLAPLMLLIALLVRLDSPGPALFKQRRHGLNRRVIEVLKFRTMRVMEDGAAVTQAQAGDARVTRLGRFLRATSLDELPQLINVLRGEMSLVGPRPHALVHDDHYGEMLERYANRHRVKPGITGLAQVSGFRGPTETPDKMRARVDRDLAYIDSWSLWLDLRILGRTALTGFCGRNAL
jgi:putative colanic acid biosynthesis UDP-glucose lipid carrier transferase